MRPSKLLKILNRQASEGTPPQDCAYPKRPTAPEDSTPQDQLRPPQKKIGL